MGSVHTRELLKNSIKTLEGDIIMGRFSSRMRKRKRLFAAIIAGVLALIMILSIAVPFMF